MKAELKPVSLQSAEGENEIIFKVIPNDGNGVSRYGLGDWLVRVSLH